MTIPDLASHLSTAGDRLGVMPLTRRLGDLLERDPVPELQPIDMPRRPYLGHYSPEAQAEMQAIYEGKKP